MLFGLVTVALAEEPEADKVGFSAGSYGRVQASTDLAGGGGDSVDVVSHPPRLGLGPYLELDLGWRSVLDDGASFEIIVTPALAGDLFHYDGQFGDGLTLRNLYVEADHVLGAAPIAFWAGSRMYRGDDIYLLDFWPLDNLNTYGGGVRWHPGDTEIAAHVGVNRLTEGDWQTQTLRVAVPGRVDGETVLVLDRQRTIASLRASHAFAVGDTLTLRLKAYGEVHQLPAGERIVDDPFQDLLVEALPADGGTAIGAQVSLWGWRSQSFVHLWARRSTGLAVWGDLAVPADGLSLDDRAGPASSWMFAATGNHETDRVGIMGAAYASYRLDADGNPRDFDDRWEFVEVVRANVYPTEHVAIAAELSRQDVRPNGLNPRSGEFDTPSITKLSLLPGIQVAKGGYARPRLQLQYTASLLDADARAFFSPFDARVADGMQHFVGVGAEWWVDSRRTITPE